MPASTWCIIGTQAVKEPEFVARACHAFRRPRHRRSRCQGRAWSPSTAGPRSPITSVEDLARRFEGDGVSAIVYTDISRDGTMQGVNAEQRRQSTCRSDLAFLSSPPAASPTLTISPHLCLLLPIPGITGAITGRAIYEGTLDFAEGQRIGDG